MCAPHPVFAAIIKNVRLCDSATDGGCCERINDACAGKDAEVGEHGRCQGRRTGAKTFGREDQAELARLTARAGRGQESEEERIGRHAAGGHGLRLACLAHFLDEGRDVLGFLDVEFGEGFGGSNDDGGTDAAAGEGEVDARFGDGVDADAGVREEGGEGLAEDVWDVEAGGGKDEIGGSEALAERERGDERCDRGGEVGVGEGCDGGWCGEVVDVLPDGDDLAECIAGVV